MSLMLRGGTPLRSGITLRSGDSGGIPDIPPYTPPPIISASSGTTFRMFNVDTGAYLGDLLDFVEVKASFEYSGVGSLSCDYPRLGRFASLLNTDIEVVAYYNGVEPRNGRWVIRGKSGEATSDDGGKLSVVGLSFFDVLRKVILYASTTFSASTPGGIIKALLATASARGAFGAASITTATFTNTLDSKGVAWANTLSWTYDVGVTYRQILESLVARGLIDFEFNGRDLMVYNGTTLGSNKDLVLAAGRHILETPFKVSTEDRANIVLVEGDNGVTAERTATGPRREESYTQQSGVSNVPTLNVIGDLVLAGSSVVADQRTIKIAAASTIKPLRDFGVGDFVIYDDGLNAPQNMRVRQVVVEIDSKGDENFSCVLNDRILEGDVKRAIQLGAIAGGVGGGTTGVPVPPPSTDTTTPSAPGSVTVTSNTYLETDGTIYAQITVSWPAVTTNTDASTITDLDHYDVQYQSAQAFLQLPANQWSANHPVPAGTTATYFGPFKPGSSVTARVRATDNYGHASAWTQSAATTVVSDTTPPVAPSTPAVSAFFRGIRVVWDGLDNTGAAMAGDYEHVDIHYSTTSAFTPSAANKVDSYKTRGGVTPINDLTYGTTYFVKLVAYDTTGNASTPSAQASATPQQLVGPDFPGLIIQNAYIANLAVDDAKIASLAAGKITTGTLVADVILGARIRTATSGNRVDISGIGIEMYRGTFRTGYWNPTNGQLRIYNDTDASYTSTGHGLQFGDDTGQNLVIDTNEILVRNNGAPEDMHLNGSGGTVGLTTTVYPGNPYSANAMRVHPTKVYITNPVKIYAGVGADANDVDVLNEDPPLMIGINSGFHVQFDNNELQSVDVDSPSEFGINRQGGDVNIHKNHQFLDFGSLPWLWWKPKFNNGSDFDVSILMGNTTSSSGIGSVFIRDFTGNNARDLTCRTLTQTSGRATKTDIVDISDNSLLDKFDDVPVYSYHLLDDAHGPLEGNSEKGITRGPKQLGPMAEDLQKVHPDLVADSGATGLAVNVASMLGVLLLNDKHLRSQLRALELEITALKKAVK